MATNTVSEYATDYKSSGLVKIRVWGFLFWVTPRFVRLYCDRLYEPVTSRLVLALCDQSPKKNLCLDIGAHYGYYALLMASRTKSKRIISIEPMRENVTILRKNVKANNFSQVQIQSAAVSNASGEKEIIVAHASDSSSFAPHPTGHKIATRRVKTTIIDSLAGKQTVGLIKLDVEGHELPAIQGAKRVMKRDQPVIIFEYHPISQKLAGHQDGDLLSLLLAHPYSLWAISEDREGLVRLDHDPIRAHALAIEAFGHEGYGNILALPNQAPLLGKTFKMQTIKAGGLMPIAQLSKYPIPGSGKTTKLTLKDSGIGFVDGREPQIQDWNGWWLRHERDYYKREFERVDREIQLFKQKWIYSLGQKVKGLIKGV